MSAPGAGATGTRNSVLSAALLSIMLFEVLARLIHTDALRAASWTAMAVVICAAVRRYGVREHYLLTLCLALSLAVWWQTPDAAPVMARALDQATFLMAFILLLGLLQEAAATSPAIESVGRYLTGQPPGRRYQALCAGSGVLSVLFNIGTVSFLIPLIQRGIATATPGDPMNPVRERRQLLAVQRGFAWAVVWSPTAIAPLAVMELIPGISRLRWSLLGLALFTAVLILGAIEDHWRFRHARSSRPRVAPNVPWSGIARLGFACAWLFGMAAAVIAATGDTVIFGLMIACPFMLVGWLAVQTAGLPQSYDMTARRLVEIVRDSLPRSAPIAVTLAASGFVGVAAAELVPAQQLAGVLHLASMPDFVLLGLLPLVIAALSLTALSPIMLAVFFGSIFGSLPELPTDPTLLALSISCGWALSMTLSPFATIVLVMERLSGVSSRTLTWDWNIAFSVAAVAIFWLVFAFITSIQ